MKPHFRVVCAIIHKQNKTLAVQRSKKMALPLKWEFPGGKIEPNETELACVTREVKEELSIDIEIGQRLTPITHEYPDFSIELIPYVSKYKSGNLTLNEHSHKRWLEKADLINLDWAAADVPIVAEYVRLNLDSFGDTLEN